MDGVEIIDPRFARYVLDNAPLETLANGFRWIEGLVWMGDAGCLLFQDLPRDRTLRWIEDVGVSREEIAVRFGEDVAGLVAEVTDDKSLPKETRKALQVEHAGGKSPRAQALSAADKIANVRSIASSPPANWSFERRVEYVRWARRVVAGFNHLDGRLAAEFQQLSAELQEWEKSGGTNDFF